MPGRLRLRVAVAVGVLGVLGAALFGARWWAAAQSNRITVGEPVQGTIGVPGETDTWQFDGAAADVVTLEVTRLSGDLVPALRVTGPDGALLLDLPWPASDPAASVSLSLRASGTHTFTITGQNRSTGDYQLSVTLADAANVTDEGTGVLIYGRPASGTIDDASYRDVWAFRGASGDVIDVRLVATSGDLAPTVMLISPQAVTMAAGDGRAGETRLGTIRLPVSGTYTLVAGRAGDEGGQVGTTAGNYELTLTLRQPGDTLAAATAVALTSGVVEYGQLTADAPSALYELQAPAGQLAVHLEMDNPAQIGVVTLLTTTGGIGDSLAGLAPLSGTLDVPQAGVVRVEVATLGDELPVAFSLVVDTLPGASGWRALRYGDARWVPASVAPVAWVFRGQAGDLVGISMAPFGTAFDAPVSLRAPDGAVLVALPVKNGFAQHVTLTQNGMYTLTPGPELAGVGYQVSLRLEGVAGLAFAQRPQPEIQGQLAAGGTATVQGAIEASQSQAWVLDVEGPQAWRFKLESDNPLALSVESPEGETLAVGVTDTLSGTARVPVDVPHAGRYTVAVFDAAGAAGGSFELSASAERGGTLTAGTTAKGVLPDSEPYDRWAIWTTADEWLSFEFEPLARSAAPLAMVLGPDGRLAGSSGGSAAGSDGLRGIPTGGGGLFEIVVKKPTPGTRLAYNLTARLTSDQGQGVQFARPVAAAARTAPPVIVEPSAAVRPMPEPDAAWLSEAAPLGLDTIARGSLSADTARQAWRFTPRAADAVVGITALAVDGDEAPGLVLFDAGGTLLMASYASQGRTRYVLQKLSGAAPYTLGVQGQGGRYALWVDELSGLDTSVPEVLPARAIGFGDTLGGEVLRPEDAPLFAFWGGAGDVVRARIALTEGGGSLRLALLDAQENIMVEGASERALEATLAAEGLYQLRVEASPDAPFRPASFALTLGRSVAATSGGGLLDEPALATLAAGGETHHWLFGGRAGEVVTVRVESVGERVAEPRVMQLADSRGTPFAERRGHLGAATLALENMMLPRDGLYQVLVSGGQRQAGAYRITLERAWAQLEVERMLAYGQPAQNLLNAGNFLDVWSFAGSAGDEVCLWARPVRGSGAALNLQLRASDGQVVATVTADDAASGPRARGVVLPSTGHYSLVVAGVEPQAAGVYEVGVDLEKTRARSAGGLLAYGQTARGALYADDDADDWLFEGQAGDTISAILSAAENGDGLSLALIDTDWHAASATGSPDILAQALAAPSEPAQLEFTLPVSGPYALHVAGNQPQAYELSLSAPSALGLPSRALRPGPAKRGEIGDLAPFEAWTFDNQANSFATISIAPDGRANLAPVLTLLDPAGVPLATAGGRIGEATTIAQYALPGAGRYTVLVGRALGPEGRTSGRYSLTLELAERAPTDAARLAVGVLARGTLDRADPSDRWVFQGQAGDAVRLRVEVNNGDLDPWLRVHAPDGAWLGAADDTYGLNPTLLVALPVDGQYAVDVGRYGGPTGETMGTYSIGAELVYRAGDLTGTPSLPLGQPVYGSLDNAATTTRWMIRGEAGDRVSARLEFTQDDAPLLLTLLDPAGNALATGQRDRNHAYLGPFELPAGGAYLLEVRRPGDARAAFSPYMLEMDFLPGSGGVPSAGGVIALGATVTGRFGRAPETHLWLFSGRAGEAVTLAAQGISGRTVAHVTLAGPDGDALLDEDWDTSASAVLTAGTVTLPANGLYVLTVSGVEASLGGVYRLRLTAAPSTD